MAIVCASHFHKIVFETKFKSTPLAFPSIFYNVSRQGERPTKLIHTSDVAKHRIFQRHVMPDEQPVRQYTVLHRLQLSPVLDVSEVRHLHGGSDDRGTIIRSRQPVLLPPCLHLLRAVPMLSPSPARVVGQTFTGRQK